MKKSNLIQFKGKLKSKITAHFLLILIIIMAAKTVSLQAQIFTKVNDQALLSKKNLGIGGGFFDYNNDGRPDIYVNSGYGLSTVFRNEGNDSFSEVFIENLIPNLMTNTGLTLGDYDNDGKQDLFLASTNGTNSLIHNEGNGIFSRPTDNPMNKDVFNQEHCAWVDYDNDGWLDLFISLVENTSFKKGGGRKNYLYHNNGDGRFTKVNSSEPENAAGNNVCANFSDFDNDGDMDLFMTECELNNHLFENINGTFKKIEAGVSSNIYSSVSCSWGDYDNDGYMDLFVSNGSTNTSVKVQSYLYHNNGDKTFTRITSGSLAEFTGNTWNGLWADFDNDGDLDIFIGTYGEPDVLFLNNGDGTFEKQNEFDETSTGTSGACFGDYNNDGFLDLFTPNVNGTGNLLYKNNGNENNWILINCTGTLSNRSAIGARVKIKATIFGRSFWQVREINGNMGFRGISELRAHFGLGNASMIDSLVIEWPSHQKTIKTNLHVNQFLSICEEIPANYLKPNFSIDVITGYSPFKVQFKNISLCDLTNPVTSWSWDLNGDGIEDSKEENPVYTYDRYEGSNYTISLKVSAGNRTETITREDYIQLLPLFQQNIALQKTVNASTVFGNIKVSNVNDGIASTFWQSMKSDTQWVQIELDSLYYIGKIVLNWGSIYGKQYVIKYSEDGNEWQEMLSVDNGDGKIDEYLITASKAKFIKILLYQRSSTSQGYKINEIEIYRPEKVEVNVNEKDLKPGGFNLYQNYPNPFNPETVIGYQLSVFSHVALKVFDILGCEVATLVNQEQKPGTYMVKFSAGSCGDGSSLSSGIYFYTLTAGEYSQTRKLVLLR